MKKLMFCGILVLFVFLRISASHAFFVGFGGAGGVEQVIKKGQDEGKIPKVPDTGETTPTSSSEWTKETLTWNGDTKALTSSCTILLPDSTTYRMYFTGPGGIWSATSTDGLIWGVATATGVDSPSTTNPSVIRLESGQYLMIYGIQLTGPTTEKLYRAISNDGITFTKQAGPFPGGAVLVADAGEDSFVSVPDLIYLPNTTTLRMYLVASTSNSHIHTATSTDTGQTWTRQGQISITGGTIGGQDLDPDIIKKSNGTYRLFFTTPPEGQSIGNLRIRSATSIDGINFTLESGNILTPSGSVNVLMDPDVILIKGTTDKYRLYYGANLSGGGPDSLRALLSP